jgi:hypothetical protein
MVRYLSLSNPIFIYRFPFPSHLAGTNFRLLR